MNKNYYTPQNNGIAGLEEYGDIEHGTNYEVCKPVYVDGVRAVGPTYEPALVADYFRTGGRITHGGTVIAKGALRFTPGWDFGISCRGYADELSFDEGIFAPGCSRKRPTTVGEDDNR